MARTAAETASILSILYEERFNQETSQPFQITWPQLRHLADIPHLTDNYLKAVNKELSDTDYYLIPCDHFLAVIMDMDMASFRVLPDRLLEKCLSEIDDSELEDDDLDEDDEVEDIEDDDEIDEVIDDDEV